jgi:hypothetical protein
MAQMKLARIMGVVAFVLAILAYGHVISLRLAVLIFLLLAAWIAYFVFIWPNVRRGK